MRLSAVGNFRDLGLLANQIFLRCTGDIRPQKMGWGIDPAYQALGVWFCATGSQLDISTSASGELEYKGNGTFGWNGTPGSGDTEVKRTSFTVTNPSIDIFPDSYKDKKIKP